MKNHVAGTHDKVNSCSQIQKDVRMKFQKMLETTTNVSDDDDDDDNDDDTFKKQNFNSSKSKIDN